MITIKKLDTAELIEDACALLYTVHVEESIWNFSPDNPSRLRAEIKNNKNMLVDRFTENAVWFGAFSDKKFIGCTRLTFSDENNKLEMESYSNSYFVQDSLSVDKSHCVESSRTAVLKSHHGLGISRFLLLAAFKYCEDNKYSVFGTSNHEYIIKLFKKIGYPLKMENAFKYEEQDPSPVNLYFADYAKSEIRNMILILETEVKNTIQNTTKMETVL
jgi:hypothetical protein